MECPWEWLSQVWNSRLRPQLLAANTAEPTINNWKLISDLASKPSPQHQECVPCYNHAPPCSGLRNSFWDRDKICFLQEFLRLFQLLKFTEQENRNVETLIRSWKNSYQTGFPLRKSPGGNVYSRRSLRSSKILQQEGIKLHTSCLLYFLTCLWIEVYICLFFHTPNE